jgi:hypothetical protein
MMQNSGYGLPKDQKVQSVMAMPFNPIVLRTIGDKGCDIAVKSRKGEEP